MRWLTFGVAALLCLGIESGLAPLAAVPGPDGVTPEPTLVLVVYLALSAPVGPAAWAGLLTGIGVDLLQPVEVAGREAVIVGPAALGYLLAAAAVGRLRSALFRRSPWTLALMTVLGGLLAHATVVGLLALRSVPWLPGEAVAGFAAGEQALRRLGAVGLTAALAVPLAPLLRATDPLWAFAVSRFEDRSRRG